MNCNEFFFLHRFRFAWYVLSLKWSIFLEGL